jgi:hypothetical protein
MNDITLLREAGPAAPPLSTAARSAARVALLDEIERSRTVRGRVRARLPRPRTALRLGAGVTVAAVAWTAAVVIAAPDAPLGPPPGSVQLVAFEPAVFPLSLEPVPAGLAATPIFDADLGALRAIYGRAGEGGDGVLITVSDDEPAFGDEVDRTAVPVGDGEADIVMTVSNNCDAVDCALEGEIRLVQERREGQWVTVTGSGGYDDPDRLVAVAEVLVDRPQPVPLRVGLAPAGWSVLAYKDDRILTLVNDSHEQQTLTVSLPRPEAVSPPEDLLDQLMGPIGPVLSVTVHGRPAYLVRVDTGYLDQEGWYLQAEFPDGTTFVVQAPEAFTQDQLLAMAEQVTYTP